MNHRMSRPFFALLILASAQALAAGAPTTIPSTPPASGQLATQLESLAFTTVEGTTGLPPLWRETAVLLKAAGKLDPAEPRYARLEYEACMAGSDSDGAQNALNTYLTLVPEDQFAQAKLIDHYSNRMQTAETILKYMQVLVGRMALPAPVRARAAVAGAETLLDRAERGEALKMLDTALQIDPLCLPALRMKYRLTVADGPSRRVGLMLAILRADPLDAEAAASIAHELSDLGMADAAAHWYSNASLLFQATGTAFSQDLGKGAAVELYLCGHTPDAQQLIDSYLASVPDDMEAWTIRLSICKDTMAAAGNYEALLHRGVNAALRHLQVVRAGLGDDQATADAAVPADTDPAIPLPPAPSAPGALGPAPVLAPTTQPLTDVPDLSHDTELLLKANRPELTEQYVTAAADLAWIRLCFLRDSSDGTQHVLDALAKLLPADDPLLARLNGWLCVNRGQWAAAQQKLSTVADRDPYAAMGMVLVYDQAGKRPMGDALARTTLATHPAGPAAAVLYSAFHARGARVGPLGQSDAVAAALQTFPPDWLNIVTDPQAFYTITAEPLTLQVNFAQPVLARLTIQNVSNYDLAIGEEGAIHPQLIFDASARGVVDKAVGQIAYDQFWQRLVLPSHQFATQIVRLDRGELLKLLTSQPSVPIDLQFAVTVNPMKTDQRGFVPGGAGCRVPFESLIERPSTAVLTDADRKSLYAKMSGGTPPERLRLVDAAATISTNNRAAARGLIIDQSFILSQELFDHLQQSTNDPDPIVRAWAGYRVALLSPPDQQQAHFGQELLDFERLEKHGLQAFLAGADDAVIGVVAEAGHEDDRQCGAKPVSFSGGGEDVVAGLVGHLDVAEDQIEIGAFPDQGNRFGAAGGRR
jgi:tetratricopeptide (TPR) repeat protein